MTFADLVYEKVKALSEPLAREVLGFVSERVEREPWQDLVAAQTTALAAVWDNPDDAVWDDA